MIWNDYVTVHMLNSVFEYHRDVTYYNIKRVKVYLSHH